jgi:hypothetical protein
MGGKTGKIGHFLEEILLVEEYYQQLRQEILVSAEAAGGAGRGRRVGVRRYEGVARSQRGLILGW